MSLTYIESKYLTDDVIYQFEHSAIEEKAPKITIPNTDEFITPKSSDKLPFERVTENRFYGIFYAHNLEAEFDDIDVIQHMSERKAAFQKLSGAEQETVMQAILQYANDNEGELLLAMRLTGRETDRNLSDELEEKYGVNTDKVRIATEMFRATYAMWKMNTYVLDVKYNGDPTKEQLEEMRRLLSSIKESANFLKHFQVPATHGTSTLAAPLIETGEVLLKSDTGEKSHFEGDGVYAGVLGSDKNYQDRQDVFEFMVPFADTLPIIASYNYPKARVCILGEGLDIKNRNHLIATASGLQQWRQLKYKKDPVNDWKLDLLEETLGTIPQVYLDANGVETVVADTVKEPIHWAMICRSLRIPRFIPQSELSKSDLAQHNKE